LIKKEEVILKVSSQRFIDLLKLCASIVARDRASREVFKVKVSLLTLFCQLSLIAQLEKVEMIIER